LIRPYGHSLPWQSYLRGFETICSKHGGRPHFAKIHHYTDDHLRLSLPRFDDFLALRAQLDPDGLFMNAYLRRHLLGSAEDVSKYYV
jgi:L-gulonolactone oxidase